MNVVKATKGDLNGWFKLAAEVEYLFGPMISDPKFIQAIKKNINQSSAFCVRGNDGAPGTCLLGGILMISQKDSLQDGYIESSVLYLKINRFRMVLKVARQKFKLLITQKA